MTAQEMDVCVVVTPRERFSTTPSTLKSLFETISASVPITVVDGGAPQSVLDEIAKLRAERPFELLTSPHVVLPSEARNIGYRSTSAKFIVFVDNDVFLEPGWLEPLLEAAENQSADIVAPLICVGPPKREKIHHAGGLFKAWHNENGIVLNETNRLMDQPYASFTDEAAPDYAEVCEFHTVLVRRSLVDRMGGFAEGLNTREHLDFCMRSAVLGGKLVFEKRSVVTYMRDAAFTAGDLPYHLYRWSNKVTNQSIRNFESAWNVLVPKRHLRVDWIGNHRSRAIEQSYPLLRRLLGSRLFNIFVVRRLERAVFEREERRRTGMTANKPNAIDTDRASAIVNLVVNRMEAPDPGNLQAALDAHAAE